MLFIICSFACSQLCFGLPLILCQRKFFFVLGVRVGNEDKLCGVFIFFVTLARRFHISV